MPRLSPFRLAAPLAVVAGLGAGLAWAATAEVTQRDRAFSTAALSIRKGDVVQIANADTVVHHIYVESAGFNYDSGEQPAGRTLDVAFPLPGTFDVLCAIHPRMKLTVTVAE